MAFRKTTLRRMSPVTRKYAKLLNELDSVLRKGKNLVEEIQRLELDSRALANMNKPRSTLSMPQDNDEAGYEF